MKTLRKPTVLQVLKRTFPKSKKPILDVATKWHSTIDMLLSLMECREFCDTSSTDPKLKFDESDWEKLEMIIKSLMPAKIATKNLQSEKLTLSDFYVEWLKCEGLTERVDSPLAKKLVEMMEQREEVLMDNDILLASVLLDPRHQGLLSDGEKARATEMLKTTWRKLQSLKSQQETPQRTEAVPPPTLSPGDQIIWEIMQKKKSTHGQRVEQDFMSQLLNYLETSEVSFEKDLMRGLQ